MSSGKLFDRPLNFLALDFGILLNLIQFGFYGR